VTASDKLQTLFAFILFVVISSAAAAADEPEEVYAKFHKAGRAANFNEMRKYGTSAGAAEMASVPAEMRQPMLDLLAQMLPETYTVVDKTIDASGNRATLQVSGAQEAKGTITLLKQKGQWKVDKADWRGQPAAAKPEPQPQISFSIPDATAQGAVRGAAFKVEKASLQSGVLELRQGADFFPDHAFRIFLFLKAGERPDGKTIVMTGEPFSGPHVHLAYKVQGRNIPETEIFMSKYVMRLEFGRRQGNTIAGKLDLRLPEGTQSFVAGTFEAEIE
jgi:hypothetical protein